jgi:hypothetical protein
MGNFWNSGCKYLESVTKKGCGQSLCGKGKDIFKAFS